MASSQVLKSISSRNNGPSGRSSFLPLLMMPLSRIWDNGIINNGQKPTVSDLEQQVKNEQSISLMDLAEAVQQEKKPSVLKKLKEQPPQSASERKPRKTKEKEI